MLVRPYDDGEGGFPMLDTVFEERLANEKISKVSLLKGNWGGYAEESLSGALEDAAL